MSSEPNKTAVISIRVKPEVKTGLELLAQEDHRSLASYLELLIIEHIDRKGLGIQRKSKLRK